MARHTKTQRIIDETYSILADFHPMTVRQVYYQLISRHIVELRPGQRPKAAYESVINALVAARREGSIPWEWIEDRQRKVRNAGDGWDDPQEYWDTQIQWLASNYRRAIWPSQPRYLEVWVEKDALSGIFEDAVSDYHVALQVGRGYNSWSAIKDAADRFQRYERLGKPTTILYFGDFDPSGVDMPRACQDCLAELGSCPTITTVSLTWEQVRSGQFPRSIEPLKTKQGDGDKKGDSRAKAFVAKYGDIAYELDAWPPADLLRQCRDAIEAHLDMQAFTQVREMETMERAAIAERAQAV